MWITFIIYKVLWCRIDNAFVFYTLRWFCSLHYLHTNLRIIKGKQKIINTRNRQMQELLSEVFHLIQNLWKLGNEITIQNLFFSPLLKTISICFLFYVSNVIFCYKTILACSTSDTFSKWMCQDKYFFKALSVNFLQSFFFSLEQQTCNYGIHIQIL